MALGEAEVKINPKTAAAKCVALVEVCRIIAQLLGEDCLLFKNGHEQLVRVLGVLKGRTLLCVPKRDPTLTYNEFYADMKSWRKYEIVSSTTDADVVFEIRLVVQERSTRLRLLILDPKSHITLWTLNQVANGANRDATTRKNFDKAMDSVVATVKNLLVNGTANYP